MFGCDQCQLRPLGALTTIVWEEVAALVNAIPHIIGESAEEQVIWIAAGRNIALVADY